MVKIKFILDEFITEMVAFLPRPIAELQLVFLKAKQQCLREERTQPAAPHKSVQRVTANASEERQTGQQVPHAFEEQENWLTCLRDIHWLHFPEETKVPIFVDEKGKKIILVGYLFSGHRRSGNLHSYLYEWVRRSGIDVFILLFNTDVSIYYGNLDHRSEVWRWRDGSRTPFWVHLIRSEIPGTST